MASAEITTDSSTHVLSDDEDDLPLVVKDLQRHMNRKTDDLLDKTATAIPVAAIKTLLDVVQRSTAHTMMGLQNDLEQAKADLVKYFPKIVKGRSHIPLSSGCDLFLHYVTRTFLELPDFEECRAAVLERGERLQSVSLQARDRIASTATDFIPTNATILTHGYSRVVAAILEQAAATKHFDLIVLEGRPDGSGPRVASYYSKICPVRIALDAAVASIMDQVDIVLMGAECVTENGGIVNKIGTLTVATCAKALSKPVYVAAESYKFSRQYPLSQSDVPYTQSPLTLVDSTCSPVKDVDPSITVVNPPVDFTKAELITLLFTDLGVLTPSAVSDELIRLYQ